MADERISAENGNPGPARTPRRGGTRAGFMIRLTLPAGMTPEQARDELRSAISFGHPEISLQYVMQEGRSEQT